MSSGMRPPDYFPDPRPGERLRMRAEEYRALRQAALRSKSMPLGGFPVEFSDAPGTIISCLNISDDTDFEVNQVVGLEEPVIKPGQILQGDPPGTDESKWQIAKTWRDRVAMKITKPLPRHRGRFGITLEPLPRDKMARVLINGLTLIQVLVSSDNDRLVDIALGQNNQVDHTLLATTPVGSGRILWLQPELERWQGNKLKAWALVQIGMPLAAHPFRAIVVGIDTNTWGGGRKRLAVQRLRSHPLGYGGPVMYVDGWVDSPIACGQEILCHYVAPIAGEDPDLPAYVAIPQFSIDQHYASEPDPAYIAVVAEAAYPIIENPCPIQEP